MSCGGRSRSRQLQAVAADNAAVLRYLIDHRDQLRAAGLNDLADRVQERITRLVEASEALDGHLLRCGHGRRPEKGAAGAGAEASGGEETPS